MALAAGAPCSWAVRTPRASPSEALGSSCHKRSSAAVECNTAAVGSPGVPAPKSWGAGSHLSKPVGCPDNLSQNSAALATQGLWNLRKSGVWSGHRGKPMETAAKGSNGVPFRPRPSSGSRRGSAQQQDSDAPLMNLDIRAPQVRLLDEDQNMVGIVSNLDALQRATDAELDLVMISPDADPPVVRIMDYSKYRYNAQKKKREAQKKAAANRQVLKELKMRYNIDTHDYAVRQRAAQRFLKDGDKVKVVCQFKGREMDFKDLAVKLFQRFQDEIGALAVVETKISLEGKTMFMVLSPNKAAMQKAAQSQASKDTNRTGGKSDSAPGVDETKQTVESGQS